MSFVEIKGIKKHFGEGDSRVEVLKGIDLSIEKEEMCVLLGPSGLGKSTLLISSAQSNLPTRAISQLIMKKHV